MQYISNFDAVFIKTIVNLSGMNRNIIAFYLIKVSKWFSLVMPIIVLFFQEQKLGLEDIFIRLPPWRWKYHRGIWPTCGDANAAWCWVASSSF